MMNMVEMEHVCQSCGMPMTPEEYPEGSEQETSVTIVWSTGSSPARRKR